MEASAMQAIHSLLPFLAAHSIIVLKSNQTHLLLLLNNQGRTTGNWKHWLTMSVSCWWVRGHVRVDAWIRGWGFRHVHTVFCSIKCSHHWHLLAVRLWFTVETARLIHTQAGEHFYLIYRHRHHAYFKKLTWISTTLFTNDKLPTIRNSQYFFIFLLQF